MDMTNAFANMNPSLLESALGFNKLVSSIQPLMVNRNQLLDDLLSIENKLDDV